MTPTRLVLALSVLLAIPHALPAQSVVPASRHVVVAAGESVKVLVDSGPCDPVWSASSDDTDVATVTPDAYTNGSKRAFTITAAEGLFADNAVVTIDLEDADCVAETSIDIQVHVVFTSPKEVAKQLKQGVLGEGVFGAAARLKNLKKQLKAAEKGATTAYKTILAELKAGTLTLTGSAPPPPGFSPSLHEVALHNAWVAEAVAFGDIWEAWFLAVGGVASDGNTILSDGGYLSIDRSVVAAVTPPDFLHGSGGLWNMTTLSSYAAVRRSLEKIDGLSRRFHAKLVKLDDDGARVYARRNTPGDGTRVLDGPTQLGFDAQTDPALDEALQILSMRATNRNDGDSDNGRLFLIGRCPTDEVLTITYQQLDAGEEFGDPIISGAFPADDGTWADVEPDISDPPDLPPGTWQVTVSYIDDDLNPISATDVIDIPVN